MFLTLSGLILGQAFQTTHPFDPKDRLYVRLWLCADNRWCLSERLLLTQRGLSLALMFRRYVRLEILSDPLCERFKVKGERSAATKVSRQGQGQAK